MSSFIWGLVFTVALAPGPATTTVEGEFEHQWTKQDVITEINRVFPDAPIMVEVARCESGFIPHAYNPTNNSHDGGIFQVSEKYHGARLRELGLDRFDVIDNIAYARILYDESGFQPWNASRGCWQL